MPNNTKITAASHLLAWVVLFSIPYILSYGQEQDIIRLTAHFWIPLVFFFVLFYLNYFVLIDRFLFSRRTALYIGSNIILIALFISVKELLESTLLQDLINNRASGKSGNGPPIKLSIYMQMLSYLAPLFFSITIKTTQQWAKTEAKRQETANHKLQSELQHLHYQLQPHFFFNSLNNIYSLVDISPEQAKTSIHSLSKLMRYMLYETNMELVALSKEVEFMEKYLALMKLRVSDKTKVTYSFPSEDNGIQIAPLLFIALIENAFKHGVSASNESHINISLSYENKRVLFNIENDNHPKENNDKSGSGIGLKNLEKRLELLYAGKYRFETSIKNGRFSVILEIETI